MFVDRPIITVPTLLISYLAQVRQLSSFFPNRYAATSGKLQRRGHQKPALGLCGLPMVTKRKLITLYFVTWDTTDQIFFIKQLKIGFSLYA